MSEYPCTLCNNFVAFTLEVLNQHQKTDQCLKAVLERMNDEQETGSTPMDIDDSDVNLGGVDVDASGDEPMDIVAPSTTGSPSIVPDNTLDSTAESSIQESSNGIINLLNNIIMYDNLPLFFS